MKPIEDHQAIIAALDGPAHLRSRQSKHHLIAVLPESGVAIAKCHSGAPFEISLFTGAVFSNEEWRRCGIYWDTEEYAVLGMLGHRFLGPNSQFAEFSHRMLITKPTTEKDAL